MAGERWPEEERQEAILEAAFEVAVRDGLRKLSMRAVAEAAGVSKGLVFFHFKDKATLLMALLDWLLERGPKLEVPEDLGEGDHLSPPARRLLNLLQHQLANLPERRHRIELFLDYWVMGTRVEEARIRIREAFDRYRTEFLPYTQPVVEAFPDYFDEDGAEGLAAVIVSFVQGCALQLDADPEGFDVDRYMRAFRGLVLSQ